MNRARPGGAAATLLQDDAASFTAFVRPCWADMHRLALRLAPGVADDVLQEALTAAWRKRGQFDPTRGTPRVWLLAIVADRARKTRRGPPAHLELVDDHPATSTGGFDPHHADLQAALGKLTHRQRTAVALHYYLGLSTEETSGVMACSVGTVKSTLSDARKRLRTVLGEDYR